MSFAPAVPAFTAAILIVVLLRAKKQVVIPYAGRIIAMMKNIFSCRNQSVLQFPHHTRGRLRSMVYTKQAISARSSTARPYPAIPSRSLAESFVNILPESECHIPTACTRTESPTLMLLRRLNLKGLTATLTGLLDIERSPIVACLGAKSSSAALEPMQPSSESCATAFACSFDSCCRIRLRHVGRLQRSMCRWLLRCLKHLGSLFILGHPCLEIQRGF